MAILSDKRVVISGTENDNAIIMVLDSAFNLVDTLVFEPWEWSFSGREIFATEDSGFVFSAYHDGNTCSNTVHFWKYNKNLQLIWQNVEGVCDSYLRPSKGYSPGGRFYYLVDNFDMASPQFSDLSLVWLDPTGFDHDTTYTAMQDSYLQVECTNDGGVIIAGKTDTSSVEDVILFRVDTQGTVLWSTVFGTPETDIATLLHPCDDGGFIVFVSQSSWQPVDTYIWIYKVDSLGNHVWDRMINTTSDDDIVAVEQIGNKLLMLIHSAADTNQRNLFIWLDNHGNLLTPYEITGNSVFCAGDTVLLGINPPAVSYLWNTGDTTSQIEVYAPGTYSALVTDSSGNTWQSMFHAVYFSNYPDTLLSTQDTITLCPYQSQDIDLDFTPHTSYQWLFNGVPVVNQGSTLSADSAGVYTCVVSNACLTDTTDSTVLMYHPDFQVSVYPEATVYCGVPFMMVCTTPGLYSWDDGSTLNYKLITGTGLARVRVTDPQTGCYKQYSKYLQLSNYPMSPIDAGNDIILCPGQSSFAVVQSAYQYPLYIWNEGTMNDSLPVQHAGSTSSEIFYVTAIDTNNCAITDSVSIISDICTGIEEEESDFSISLTRDNLLIRFPNESSRYIQIVDISGRIISNFTSVEKENIISTGNLSAGIYLLEINDGRKRFARKFFIR